MIGRRRPTVTGILSEIITCLGPCNRCGKRSFAGEPIPKYRRYHRPIVHLPSFCSDDSRREFDRNAHNQEVGVLQSTPASAR